MLNAKDARAIVAQKIEERKVALEKAVTAFIEGSVAQAVQDAASKMLYECNVPVPTDVSTSRTISILENNYGFSASVAGKNRLCIRWK